MSTEQPAGGIRSGGCTDMANADIVVVGMGELPLIADLFNDIFRPPRDLGFFQRRLHGRTNPLILLAQVGGRPGKK